MSAYSRQKFCAAIKIGKKEPVSRVKDNLIADIALKDRLAELNSIISELEEKKLLLRAKRSEIGRIKNGIEMKISKIVELLEKEPRKEDRFLKGYEKNVRIGEKKAQNLIDEIDALEQKLKRFKNKKDFVKSVHDSNLSF